MMQKSVIASIFLVWGCLGAVTARGDMLADMAQKAVLKNPEVLSRWHDFLAAEKEIGVARGAYFPSIDLSAGTGRERSRSVLDTTTTLNRDNASLTLTQMLYDGSAVRNEVRRLTNTQLTRYYELLDASENAALEAARAYYDVLRHRKLYALTEDNYVSHRTVFEQIQQKVQAGVGRRVDLEQAAGRLALSEANLVADNANVHDASARFQRIIGEIPPAALADSASLDGMIMPKAADAHLSVAVDLHPAVLAAVENVRAARYDLDGRKARYQPKVDFRLSRTRDNNIGGVEGKSSNAVAEVVASWNLFSGGSDSARVSQYIDRLDAARYQRDKICRDIRMTLAIAYNDVFKLKEQIKYLEQHRLSIEKARGAYQKQFEIGQRSLLDLLDTENEVFQARRSYVNAEHDLSIAHVRTLAGMGRLVGSLKLERLATDDLPELLGTASDAPETCPPEAPLAINIKKDELDARAVAAAKPPEQPVAEAGPTAEEERFLQLPGEARAEAARIEAEQEGVPPPDTEPVAPDTSAKPLAPVQDAKAAAEEERLPQLPDDAPAEKIKEKKDEAARVKAGKDAEAQAVAEEKARQATQAEAEQEAEAGMVKSEAEEEFGAEVSSIATATGKGQANGVDWSGKQFWLVEMHEVLERDAVAAAWRNLRTRFSNQMENKTIIPRLQGRGSVGGKEQVPGYQLFIADFPEKQLAEEFCTMLRLEQQRCGVLQSRSLAEREVLNATSAGTRDGF